MKQHVMLGDLVRRRIKILEPGLRILHVSDQHFEFGCGRLRRAVRRAFQLRSHRQTVWDALRQSARQLAHPVNVIVCTGDLSVAGDAESLRFARRSLLELAVDCGLPEDAVLVVPGNHDRFTRYLSWRNWRALGHFEDVFGNLMRPRRLAIGTSFYYLSGFDSTERGWQPFPVKGNQGEVRVEDFTACDAWLQEAGYRPRAPGTCFIAALHHHPLPVPANRENPFTIMRNGGLFLAHLQELGAQLVLHGHEHEPHACRISYAHDKMDVVVCGAGSACQHGNKELSFSVVEMIPGLQARVLLYGFDGGGFVLDEARTVVFHLDC